MLILAKVRIKILADFAKYIEIYKLGAPESTRGVAPTIWKNHTTNNTQRPLYDPFITISFAHKAKKKVAKIDKMGIC